MECEVAEHFLRHANAPTTDALTADHVRTAAREWVLQAATPGEGVEEGVTFASDRAAAMAVLAFTRNLVAEAAE